MKKRTFALLLVAVMLFALTCGMLTACDNSGEGSGVGESLPPEPSESLPPEPQSEAPESVPFQMRPPESAPREPEYDAKAVLADMTTQEACQYLVAFFLSDGTPFTDPNKLDPEMLVTLLFYKVSPIWNARPHYYYKDGWVRMTHDEVIEELQHYLDIDPDRLRLRERIKGSYLFQFFDEETDTFRFNPALGNPGVSIYPLEDRWEGDRRIITFDWSPAREEPPEDPKYCGVFTLEQNGEYVHYVSYEIIPIK